MKTKKDIKSTFIDLEIALTLDRRLTNKLQSAGVGYNGRHLNEVLQHHKMTPSLEKALVTAVEKILDRRKRKYPRPALRPKKDWSRQF
jgi:UDP-glucose 6-dehydrogenase